MPATGLLQFMSRLGNSTIGQFAEVQVSFDGSIWQTLWIQRGGSAENLFGTTSVGMDDLVGRAFELRFRYIHDPLRSGSYTSGADAGTGWFIDRIEVEGFEELTEISNVAFTGSSFTLDSITSLIDPFLATGGDEEDRFLFEVEGLHSGTGFSESVGYGKPFVIRVRDSYEDFLDDNFTALEQEDPLVTGEDVDPDEDGFSNLVEHGFGTDPNVANVQNIAVTNTPGAQPDPSISFSWNSLAGYGYGLEMGTTLADDFVPIPYVETTTPNGDLLNVVLKPDPSLYPLGDRAFFRLSIPSN